MPTSNVAPKKLAKNKLDFRSQFDKNYIIPNRIKTALEAMALLGPETWETEKEFLDRTKISTTDLALFRKDFEAFIVVAKSDSRHEQRIWCCSKKLATELRGLPT